MTPAQILADDTVAGLDFGTGLDSVRRVFGDDAVGGLIIRMQSVPRVRAWLRQQAVRDQPQGPPAYSADDAVRQAEQRIRAYAAAHSPRQVAEDLRHAAA